MKKVTVIILLVGLAGLAGLASDVLSCNGDIIDNMCAVANKGHLADFLKAHPEECALMSHCVASGYSIFTDGKVYSFDQASGKKVEAFLKRPESTLHVVVNAEKVGKDLKLVSIENQK